MAIVDNEFEKISDRKTTSLYLATHSGELVNRKYNTLRYGQLSGLHGDIFQDFSVNIYFFIFSFDDMFA